jgi:hypothetical protein
MPIRPAAICAARAIIIAGIQIRMLATGSVAITDAAIASISPSCAVSPFIFQFPALNGRALSSLQRPAMGHFAVPQRQ